MNVTLKEKLNQTAAFLETKTKSKPAIGIVLGSGLGVFVDKIENKTIVQYNDIPHFKKTTVEGHQGQMIFGEVNGTPIVALQGRFHPYEGLEMEDVTYPVRLLGQLGVKKLILTNAAGGVNLNFKPGDLVIIDDHINLMGRNPLVGPNDNAIGPRFPDMGEAYNREMNSILENVSEKLGKKLARGVYAGVLGPTYETPAEIRMIRTLGGDMVGMSTVPETIVAHHMGLKVCGISCITNMGAGILKQKLKHEDIKDEAMKAMHHFTSILNVAISEFAKIQ
jgi:purine-nucleoside phosphorylase